MLSSAGIERRLLAVLAEPVESAEGCKRALLDVLRVLGRAGDKHVIAGDIGLSLRAVRPGSMRLEMAVPSLAAVAWGCVAKWGSCAGDEQQRRLASARALGAHC
ncbi:MAG: hypothetical protein WBV96_08110 [Polyangia bacterium]